MNFGEEKLSENFTINVLQAWFSPLMNFKPVGIKMSRKTCTNFMELLQ